MQDQGDSGPPVLMEPVSCRAVTEAGRWLAAWRIHNLSDRPLEVVTVRLPHGRFRGQERELDPPPRLAPGESYLLELSVACNEPPGTIVENAFVILRVMWDGKPWRVLARLRINTDAKGVPTNTVELVTTQPIGFSGTLPREV